MGSKVIEPPRNVVQSFEVATKTAIQVNASGLRVQRDLTKILRAYRVDHKKLRRLQSQMLKRLTVAQVKGWLREMKGLVRSLQQHRPAMERAFRSYQTGVGKLSDHLKPVERLRGKIRPEWRRRVDHLVQNLSSPLNQLIHNGNRTRNLILQEMEAQRREDERNRARVLAARRDCRDQCELAWEGVPAMIAVCKMFCEFIEVVDDDPPTDTECARRYRRCVSDCRSEIPISKNEYDVVAMGACMIICMAINADCSSADAWDEAMNVLGTMADQRTKSVQNIANV